MQIFLKTPSGKTITILTNPNDTIGRIKEIVRNKEGIPLKEQRLVRAGKPLKEQLTLGHYNIQNHETIHMYLCLKGGGKEPDLIASTPATSVQLKNMRTMTLNIRQGTKENFPLVLDHLHAHEIDVAFITETGKGANISDELDEQGEDGYVAHEAPLQGAGVTILIRKRWNHTVNSESIIQKGRILAVTLLDQEGAEIILVGVYQKTGLDAMTNTDQDLLQAQANIDQIIDLIDPRDTSLVICEGDLIIIYPMRSSYTYT
jgi:hypothetical protein